MIDHHRDPISAGYEYPVKQRKIRKGTRSCWECKRRKVRCSFSAINDNATVCVACRRRRTPCVSQEFLEDHALPSSPRIVAPVHESATSTNPRIHKGATNSEPSNLLTPESSRSSTLDGHQALSGANKLAELSKVLHAAFPPQQDIDNICEATSACSLVITQLHTQPRNEIDLDEDRLKRELAEIPPSNTHPIILARHMLLLANLLLHAVEPNIKLVETPQAIMDRLVDTVTTLVLTKESLVTTVDGLQCILLEGTFHANGGSLRNAWLSFRRALSLGQLLGLDRPRIPSLQIIDSKRKIDVRQLWFRILYYDTFYSMMLGLPQGNVDTSTLSYNTLFNNTSIDQLELLQVQVASRIIERDKRHSFAEEYNTTQDIDNQLLQVARDMPNRFWLPPPPTAGTNKKEAIIAGFQDTFVLMDILIYYNLLNQLHLPYLLWSDSGDTSYEYSKMACIQASREILTRFIILLNHNQLSFFCQRIDYFVLMASMTLLLVYLGNHRSSQDAAKGSSAIHQLLTPHQRLSDRATMKQALRLIERTSAEGFEEYQRKGVNLLRCLLSIEADAASGQNYIISTGISHSASNSGHQRDSEYFDTHSSDVEDSVSINIPYLGMIKITRQASAMPEMTNPLETVSGASYGETMYQSSTTNQVPEQLSYSSCPLQDLGDDLTGASDSYRLSFQDIDLDFFDSLVRGRDFEFGLEEYDGMIS